jgi:hypothetical protein
VIKIITVLCNLSSPTNCHERTVTTSDRADVSITPHVSQNELDYRKFSTISYGEKVFLGGHLFAAP